MAKTDAKAHQTRRRRRDDRTTTRSSSAEATTGSPTRPTSPRAACGRSCSSAGRSSAARRSPRSFGPGFWFTTFSYALSLLRPDIIQDLDLVKHGFMPILMPTTFCPKENGDYLLLGQDHGENHQEIARHCKHDADAYDAFNHDVDKVLQAIKPLSTRRRRTSSATTPRSSSGSPRSARASGNLDRKVLHDADPAADRLAPRTSSTTTSSPTSSRATSPRRASSARRSGRTRRARGSSCCTTSSASTTASSARGRSTSRATAASPRCWPARPRRSAPRSSSNRRSRHVITENGRATGVALADGGEYHAPIVVSALDPRRTFLELVDPRELPTRPRRGDPAVPVPGHVGEGQLRARRDPAVPGARRPNRPVPRLHQHRAVDGVPRAGLR